MKLVGKTQDNKLVIAGVFRYYETIGLPLDVIFECFIQKNCIPDWLCFYVEAFKAGMKHDRILEKLSAAISDTYGVEIKNKVVEILEKAK